MRRLVLAGVVAAALAAPAFAAAIKQGGTMTVTYKDDFTTLDPAIGYDWQNWSPLKSLFSRLMDYKPGTTELAPDLAESYEVSADGLTYTFHLRHGVKFTNGRELTADDVKYTYDRTTNPKTQSPGAGFFKSIKGFDDIQAGKTDTLAGVTAVDPDTVKIELSKPDATFMQVVALNFSGVVPKEEVAKWGADFGHHPVGSGPYKMTEWTLGQRIVFERNKDFYVPGFPYLDKIVFEIGQEPLVALLRLQKGEIDLAGDSVPPAKFLEVMNDPTWSKLTLHAPQLQTGYVTMNVEMKPFDDVRVRKAVNMAINKERIIKIINGRAVPAVQPLPPGDAGLRQGLQGLCLRRRQGQGADEGGGLRRRRRDRALRLQHRPEPAHRAGDPAGPRRDRHQGGDQVARPGERHRRRRHRKDRADDLVGRHGLDRRLPRPVRLLRADPRLRRRDQGRLELVVVLQQGPRGGSRQGRRHGQAGGATGAGRALALDLHQDHG